MFVHHATVVLEPDDDLVVGSRDIEYRRDLLAQRSHRGGLEVAFEIDDEAARPVARRLRLGFLFLLAVLGDLLAFAFAEDGIAQRVCQGTELLVEVLDLEPLVLRLATRRGGKTDDDDDCRNDGQYLQKKQPVLGEKLAHANRASDSDADVVLLQNLLRAIA